MQFKNLSHTVYNINRKLLLLMGKSNNLLAMWWGVKLGKHASFIGKCHFKRYPGTTINIGDNCTFYSTGSSNLIGINRPCIISTSSSPFKAYIQIGDNCGFSGTVIGAFKKVIIGNNVRCGANTLITDSDWHLDDPRSGKVQAVNIEDNVWLGANSVVLKGVTIGMNTVIGANSVVTKSIPPNVIAAGNPCKVIRSLESANVRVNDFEPSFITN